MLKQERENKERKNERPCAEADCKMSWETIRRVQRRRPNAPELSALCKHSALKIICLCLILRYDQTTGALIMVPRAGDSSDLVATHDGESYTVSAKRATSNKTQSSI